MNEQPSRHFSMSGTPAAPPPESAPASPTGTPLIAPRFVPLLIALCVGAAAGLEVLAADLAEGSAGRTVCRALQVALVAFLGAASPGLRKGVAVLALCFAVGLSAPAMAAPADAPLLEAPAEVTAPELAPDAHTPSLALVNAPVPTPRPAWEPSWQDCRRWDVSERNWKKVQRWAGVIAGVSGALGAVLALSLKSEEAGAIGGFSAALSGGVAWLSGEQAEDYRKQFDEWCRAPLAVAK